MVGVPGRSKACITCRQRKKGCDYARPACAQCKTAGFECGGYRTQPVFVVSTPRSRHAGYSVSDTAALSGRSSWQRRPRNPAIGDSQTPYLLARPAYERRSIDLFWEAYFPMGQPIPERALRSYTCTWTETAQRLYREDDSLRYALWANCLIILRKRHGALWMLREGQRMYGKALGTLRRLLSSPLGPRRDAAIATIKLLSMFEAAFSHEGDETPGQDHSGTGHHAGELALFVASTPMAHISGDAHYIFADERVEMALSALLRGNPLDLSTPEWKSIPWREIPKDLKDVLVDVLVDMPGLVEQADALQSCTDPGSQAGLRLELVQRCWEHDRNLQSWLSVITELGPPGHDPLVDCNSTRVAQVHGMSLFHTTGLVLYSILQMAAGSQAGLSERVSPLHHLTKLAEAIRILHHPSAGLYGQQSAALPLEIALKYTAAWTLNSPQRRRLLESLTRMRKR